MAKLKLFQRFIIILTASVLAAVGSYLYLVSSWRPEVVFFDVGQGDAILIKTPNGRTVLIDGGPDNRVLRRLGDNLPFYRRQIDFMIYSHYHDDHVIGLVETVKRYKVKNLLYADGGFDSAVLEALQEEAGRQKTPLIEIASQARVSLGPDCFLDLLNPSALGVAKEANNSVIIFLNCAGERFLFSGDNDAKVENAFLASGYDPRADVFKASHHGSKTANGAGFLSAVNPRFLVIPVGADNKFGHPNSEVLERAATLGISVWRTDKDGDIRFSLSASDKEN